jgi:hypothetical protein
MLAVAEAVECFEVWQGRGWDPLHTNGEGLSRVLAHTLYPTLIPRARLADAVAYLRGNPGEPPMPDCINDNSRSDQDPAGNGGGVLFLNWLTSGLGYALDQVVQNGGPSLADTYENLTGRNDAYERFMDDLQAATHNGVTSDNPFTPQVPLDTPSAPVAVGNHDWRLSTTRRISLIDQKYGIGLRPDEELELERLQQLSLEALDRDHPVPRLGREDIQFLRRTMQAGGP